jgi:hypothetical protein
MGRERRTNGETRNAYRILVGSPEGKRPLRRLRRRWMDNIVTHMTPVRERLSKHVPKITLSTTEESLKAGMVHC